jgi:hypothetical protein
MHVNGPFTGQNVGYTLSSLANLCVQVNVSNIKIASSVNSEFTSLHNREKIYCLYFTLHIGD